MSDGLEALLEATAADVLETMFFAMPVGDGFWPVGPSDESLAVALDFAGDRTGSLHVALTPATALNLAVNFLGTEDGQEPTSQEVFQVVCEMANMLCGALLSRFDRNGRFDLRPARPANAAELPKGTAQRILDLGDGPLALTLRMDAADGQ